MIVFGLKLPIEIMPLPQRGLPLKIRSKMAMAPLRFDHQNPAVHQFGKMRAGGLLRDPAQPGQSCRGKGAPIHQRDRHRAAYRASHESSHAGDIRTFSHSSILIEPFSASNRLRPGSARKAKIHDYQRHHP